MEESYQLKENFNLLLSVLAHRVLSLRFGTSLLQQVSGKIPSILPTFSSGHPVKVWHKPLNSCLEWEKRGQEMHMHYFYNQQMMVG